VRADARVCALVLACVLGSGCAWFTRPDGDGGWDAERRREEMARRQSAAASPATSVSTAPDAGATPDVAEPIPGRDPSRPMDLADALVLASRGNRRIAEARQQLLASAERVADVRGRFLPSTAAQARYTLYSSSQTTNVEFPDGLLPPGVPKPDVVVREADVGTVNATVYFPLDFTGELRHTLEAAQAGYRGERARVWATTLDEQLAVVQGYFQLLEARRLRAVTEQTIAVYRTQVGITQARFDQERLTKNDLLTVQVALLTAEQSLLARDLAIEQARWSFNQVVGRRRSRPWRTRSRERMRITRSCCPSWRSSSGSRRRRSPSSAAACHASARVAAWTTLPWTS